MLLPGAHGPREKFQGELEVWYSCSMYSFKEFGVLDGKTKKKCFPSGLMDKDWLHLLQLIIEN